MFMKKITLSLIITIGLLTGCATTVPPFATDSENSWFLEHRSASGSTVPIFCMANKQNGYANPKCYNAETLDPPKVSTEKKLQ
jgi:hypothetical protein